MKLRRLITRRRAKWAGTTLVALLIMVFIVSGKYWGGVGWPADGSAISREWIVLGNGQLRIDYVTRRDGTGTRKSARWEFRTRRYYGIDWGWEWESRLAGRSHFRRRNIPLWFPLVLIAAPTAWLWYTDRRAKPWQCAKCRYDLRGLEGGVCPECGESIVPRA